MDAFRIVVADVLSESAFPVIFMEYDDGIEKLSTNDDDESLRSSVLPGVSEGRAPGTKLEPLDREADVGREDRVTFEAEDSVRRLIGNRITERLDHPASRWTLGDADVENSSAFGIERNPDVEQLEANGEDHEDVHPRDDVPGVPQEAHPAWVSVWVRLGFRQVTRTGREAHLDPELRELHLDLPRAPAVLWNQSESESP
jgi:hypothetical protein